MLFAVLVPGLEVLYFNPWSEINVFLDPRLSKFTFRTVVVDEATQAAEPEILIPLVMGARQVVKINAFYHFLIFYYSGFNWRSSTTWTCYFE